jgi:hypothetical protein
LEEAVDLSSDRLLMNESVSGGCSWNSINNKPNLWKETGAVDTDISDCSRKGGIFLTRQEANTSQKLCLTKLVNLRKSIKISAFYFN